MAKLRPEEVEAVLDQEPVCCASCDTLLREEDTTYCPSCASYWEDASKGLFDDDDWTLGV